MTNKYALIIGNSDYADDHYPPINAARQDVTDLADLLRDPCIGAFDRVDVLNNATMLEMRRAIADLFGSKHLREDMLLFYFSGHGELDHDGNLYFVAHDTEHGYRLNATSLEASFVAYYLNEARSRRQVIILDSCYSGAFGTGAKGQRVGTKQIFDSDDGAGRFVLTASDALQLSWEGNRIIKGQVENSFFTHFLIEGLRTGQADMNNDGYIDLNELYHYIYDGMIRVSSKQTPLKFTYKERGNLRLALRRPVTQSIKTEDILPPPFTWIPIPYKGFSIAKYPVTNAQFAKFVKADDYFNPVWWPERMRDQALSQIQKDGRKLFNSIRLDAGPVLITNISISLVIAYTRWLSEQTGQNITLPTKALWECADQGSAEWVHPLGNLWELCASKFYDFGKKDYGKKDFFKRPLIVRGGSWKLYNFLSSIPSGYAHALFGTVEQTKLIGFRLVLISSMRLAENCEFYRSSTSDLPKILTD